MADFAEQLAQVRRLASTGEALPPDLARWAAGELSRLAPAARRREARDALLHLAASTMSGTTWSRAVRVAATIRRLQASGRPSPRAADDDDGAPALVAQAIELGPRFRSPSARHLYSIIRTRGV